MKEKAADGRCEGAEPRGHLHGRLLSEKMGVVLIVTNLFDDYCNKEVEQQIIADDDDEDKVTSAPAAEGSLCEKNESRPIIKCKNLHHCNGGAANRVKVFPGNNGCDESFI